MTSRLATVIRTLVARPNNEAFAAAPRPHDPADYERPELDGSGASASDLPLDGTKPGASLAVWPSRTLAECREPLASGAPDLRGVWEVVDGRMKGHVERIEQAGNRITITVGGLVHDMFCDGTLENGVNDTAGIGGRRIRVAARWKNGVHKLRPWNTVVAVTRQLNAENGDMIWRYGRRINRLRRLTEPPFDHPATRAAAEAAGTLPD